MIRMTRLLEAQVGQRAWDSGSRDHSLFGGYRGFSGNLVARLQSGGTGGDEGEEIARGKVVIRTR